MTKPTIELTPEQQALAPYFTKPFETPQEMRDWILAFFGIDFPQGSVDPDSNSSPIDWMFEAYQCLRHNQADDKPVWVVYSSRDSYKCQIKGTKLLTKNGLINIENAKKGDIIWSGKGWRKITDWIDDGTKDGIEIVLANGLKVTGSPVHRYWGARDGIEQWLRSDELQPGDRIQVNLDNGYASQKLEVSSQKLYDIGYLLGILIGDGSLSFLDSTKTMPFFALTTTDPYIKEFFFSFCKSYWDHTPTLCTDGITYRVANKQAVKWIKDTCGVKSSTSNEKEIPPICYKSFDAMIGFVNGVFDSDGTFCSKNSVMFPMTAEKLLRELQSVFISWGINARLYESKVPKGGNYPIFKLYINANEVPKLVDLGFKSCAKKAGHYRSPQTPDAHDSIPKCFIKDLLNLFKKTRPKTRKGISKRKPNFPTYKTVTWAKLSKIIDWVEFAVSKGWIETGDAEALALCDNARTLGLNRFFEVKKVTSIPNCHFYDLTVEEDHSYWSNGVVSHNTLSCSAFEVIVMIHFNLTVAHMAAIKSQSAKAIQYINNFIRKCRPYFDYHNMKVTSQSKSNISITNEAGDQAYVAVIVCTLQGANCISPDSTVHYWDGSTKLAKQVQVGDQLKTWDYTTQEFVPVIVGDISYTQKKTRELVFDDGSNLVLSDDHQVFTQRGWIPAAKVRVGDRFFSNGNNSKTNYKNKEGLSLDGGAYRLVSESSPDDDCLDFTRCIKTGKVISPIAESGFSTCAEESLSGDKDKEWVSRIDNALCAKIKGINLIGNQRLIDIHINTKNEHHKSFICNGYLVHNSEHTNLMCVDKDTKILVKAWGDTATKRDRKSVKISTLYNRYKKGLPIEALSFNHLTGAFEFKPVSNMIWNKKEVFELKTIEGKTIRATSEHRFFVNKKGYLPLSEVKEGDELFLLGRMKSGSTTSPKDYSLKIKTNYPDSTEFEQMLIGGLLGDMSIHKKPTNNAHIYMTHSPSQSDYAEFKKRKLSNVLRMRTNHPVGGYLNKQQIRVSSGNSPLLNEWVDFRKTLNGVEKLGPLGLAIWFQDDGVAGRDLRFCTHSFSLEQQKILQRVLKSNFDIEVDIRSENKADGRCFYYLGGKNRELAKLQKITEPFIHESMKYKFEQMEQGGTKSCITCGETFFASHSAGNGFRSKHCGSTVCQSVKLNRLHPITVDSIKSVGLSDVYDMTVEDNHNYFANSILTHNCVDEIDVVQYPQAFEEAKLIPGVLRGRYPMTIMTSTRKFAFGLMQKEITKAESLGRPIRHWNIIDITEKCKPDRHKPDKPKQVRYIKNNLPLKQISEEEYERVPVEDKSQFSRIEAYEGCVSCKLLPVCKMQLAHRPEDDSGGLYKPIPFTINQFDGVEPDMAEAQLLCFSEFTQILMADGSCKYIKDVQVGDQVISHTGNIRKVTQVMSRPYTGRVVQFSCYNWRGHKESFITPEHPVFIDGKRWVSIKDVTPSKFDKQGRRIVHGDYLSMPSSFPLCNQYVLDCSVFLQNYTDHNSKIRVGWAKGRRIPRYLALDADFGWLVGYYLAEGHVSSRVYSKERRRIGIHFASHVKETEMHARVSKCIEKLGLTVINKKTKSKYGHIQIIYNSTLAELLIQICGTGAGFKKIHNDLLNSNLDFLRGVLQGFYDGDGTKRRNSYLELTTVSETLASQLYLIGSRFGLCPRLVKKPKPTKGKQAFLIHMQDPRYKAKQNRTRYISNEYGNLYRFDQQNWEDFSGTVYNLEVEGDHSYIANGVSVHNCWKPSASGLVYGRFDAADKQNTLTLEDAWYNFTGSEPFEGLTLQHLIDEFHRNGVRFYVGGDWGFRHLFALVVGAILPSGEFWLFETFGMSGLEFDDMMKYSKMIRDRYNPKKWFMDTAQPMFIKSFKRHRMPCQKFTKDVMGGIESIRSQVVDSAGRRRLKVIKTKENQILIDGFQQHHFKTDAAGNVTQDPDDEEFADIMDGLRYMGQNLFGLKKTTKTKDGADPMTAEERALLHQKYQAMKQSPTAHHNQQINERIRNLAGDDSLGSSGKSSTGTLMWDFSDPFDES